MDGIPSSGQFTDAEITVDYIFKLKQFRILQVYLVPLWTSINYQGSCQLTAVFPMDFLSINKDRPNLNGNSGVKLAYYGAI